MNHYIHDLLDAAASRYPDKVAILSEASSWNYTELQQRSSHLYRWLKTQNVQVGDRILCAMPNSSFVLAALFAASRLGAVFVPIHEELKSKNLSYIVSDCEPTIIFAAPTTAKLLGSTHSSVVIMDTVDDASLWDQFGLECEPYELATGDHGLGSQSDMEVNADQPVLFIYTSGSTGNPKAVISTHQQVLFAASSIQQCLQVQHDDIIGNFLPLSFDYGLYQMFLVCYEGATLALGHKKDIGPMWLKKLYAWGVTGLPLMPAMADGLLKLSQRPRSQLPALRFVTNTGAAFPASYVDSLSHLYPDCSIFLMYGLTECKRVAILPAEEARVKVGSVGKPIPGTTCKVINKEGGEAAPFEIGELVVRGPHVMSGYWKLPELTATRFSIAKDTGERQLYTGDFFYADEDGYLYYQGRSDDVFKQQGYRVSAIELEETAVSHPNVRMAVLLKPDEQYACVLAVTGEVEERELLLFMAEQLEYYKLPERIVVLDALPTTLNGKIDKQALRLLLEAVGNQTI
ncbi:class I adenylate-forming enzyme family protein [Paenibacillus assamensis]|uniref:class I adenylate-forming enzyme family protein n=1 Tax=Paenibacillus assamensis TaxID=311244 RepID=UPI0004024B48|nr:class I adenylate-forming enzyme family protein [Paenibacillus assamensis]